MERTTDKLANVIWNYYLQTKIPYIERDTLIKEALGKDWYRGRYAIKILEERGVVTSEYVGHKWYCRFYFETEDIKKNLYDIQIWKTSNSIFQSNRNELIDLFLECMEEKKKITFGEALDYMIDFIVEKKYNSNKDVVNMLAKRTIIETQNLYKIDIVYKEIERNNVITYLTEQEEAEARMKAEQRREEERDEKLKPFMDTIMVMLEEHDIEMTIAQMLELSEELEGLSGQKVSAIVSRMCEKGMIVRRVKKKRAYFCLPYTLERIKAEEAEEKEKMIRQKQLEEIWRHNDEIRRSIEKLVQEKRIQENIVMKNTKKLFGFGTKAKKDAQNRIEIIEREINMLKQKIKLE